MKLSILLNRRAALQRQVRLADLAYAYQKLSEFSARITRAQLRGKINLKQAAPDDGRCWASLTALAGNQSVIEEHFTDEDVMDLADLVAFVANETNLDVTFRIERLPEIFLAPLRHQLEQGGVFDDPDSPLIAEPNRRGVPGR